MNAGRQLHKMVPSHAEPVSFSIAGAIAEMKIGMSFRGWYPMN